MKRNIEAIREWQQCSRQRAREAPQKKRTPLPKRTANRAAQEREYSERRKIYLEAHPLCERCLVDGIEEPAAQLHHKRGRDGERLLDESEFAALCVFCHDFTEAKPAEAMKEGWIKSRHRSRDELQ